jgi:hypothetical protein
MNNSKCLLTAFLFFTAIAVSAQANLTIVNNSARSMTIKIMKKNETKSSLHKQVNISAHNQSKIYFSANGNYCTKSKATLKGKDPICKKGNPFKVTNDSTGYSELVLTYTITESQIPSYSGGTTISESEFDKD